MAKKQKIEVEEPQIEETFEETLVVENYELVILVVHKPIQKVI